MTKSVVIAWLVVVALFAALSLYVSWRRDPDHPAVMVARGLTKFIGGCALFFLIISAGVFALGGTVDGLKQMVRVMVHEVSSDKAARGLPQR